MKLSPAPAILVLMAVAMLALSGCSTTKTYAGRKTSILSGLAEIDAKSYQPLAATTVAVSTAADRPGSKLTGKRVSLFWGLFTFADY